jgi:hypothetical protein
MASKRRTLGAYALIALVAALLTAVVAPYPADHGKEAAVQTALNADGRGEHFAVLQEAIGRAHALTAIRTGGEITLVTTGSPFYRTSTVPGEDKLVVDLYDTINLASSVALGQDDHNFLRGVSTSLHALEPQFISRVVIDLASPAEASIEQTDRGLVIGFAPDAVQTASFGPGEWVGEVARAHSALDNYDAAMASLRDGLHSSRQTSLDAGLNNTFDVALGYSALDNTLDAQWAAVRTQMESQIADCASTLGVSEAQEAVARVDFLVRGMDQQWKLFRDGVSAATENTQRRLATRTLEGAEPSISVAQLDGALDGLRIAHADNLFPALDIAPLLHQTEAANASAGYAAVTAVDAVSQVAAWTMSKTSSA